MKKVTTKHCWRCESTALILLTSLNKKMCSSCGFEMDWYLDPGQKPIFEGATGEQQGKRRPTDKSSGS